MHDDSSSPLSSVDCTTHCYCLGVDEMLLLSVEFRAAKGGADQGGVSKISSRGFPGYPNIGIRSILMRVTSKIASRVLIFFCDSSKYWNLQ